MVNTDISVEELIYWIERATNDYEEGWDFHAWDVEYAQDSLNELLPGLGDYVSLLRREHPIGSADYYKRGLITLFNIFKLLQISDESLRNEVIKTFDKFLGDSRVGV